MDGMQTFEKLSIVEAELGVRNQSGITVKSHANANGQITALHLVLAPNDKFDVSPLRLLTGLKVLRLEAMRQDGLGTFPVTVTNLAELWPLKLEEFHCSHIRLEHLAPLKGMPLIEVRCDHCDIKSLEPLRGMMLKSLNASDNPINDIRPLEKVPLERLDVSDTLVADLTPLKGMPLIELKCVGTRVQSLESLVGNTTLAALSCPPLDEKNTAIVRRLPALRVFNGGPVP
jgi:Leucine-rich repeat (LRR) protein